MKIAQYISMNAWGNVNPETMATGLGGRETACVMLAEAWAEAGHDVTVYAPNDSALWRRTVAGGSVTYAEVGYALPVLSSFPHDVVLSWESPEIFAQADIRRAAKLTIVGLQVAHTGCNSECNDNIDYWALLSPWARRFLLEQLPYVNPKQTVIFPNGVDIRRYPYAADSTWGQTKQFLYASSPDRGLNHLLAMWPKIRGHFPGCTLKIAYGTDKFIESAKWSHSLQAEMAFDIEEQIDQEGVINLGKIGQDELAKLHYQSDALLYPADTMAHTETGCITVVEAMAAGNVPVITDCDCLGEEFGNIAKTCKMPFNETVYLNSLFDLFDDPDDYGLRQKRGRHFAELRDWKIIADRWLAFFNKETK